MCAHIYGTKQQQQQIIKTNKTKTKKNNMYMYARPYICIHIQLHIHIYIYRYGQMDFYRTSGGADSAHYQRLMGKNRKLEGKSENLGEKVLSCTTTSWSMTIYVHLLETLRATAASNDS